MAVAHGVEPQLVSGPSFELAIRYSRPTVVAVRGELDALTAPGLGALIDSLVDAGHGALVLDVSALEFMDAAGLGVLAAASDRLRPSGGAVEIRSPSSLVRRILGITGMLDLVEADKPTFASSVQEPERLRLAPVGSMLPSSRDVVDAALRLVAALASEMVTGADGASVTLRRHGKLSTVGASNAKVFEMDRDQYTTGEGPCLSASAEGQPFHVNALTEETRWPQFVPRAIEHGIASILSTPLMVADLPVGALNMYSNTERAFGPGEQEMAALFASHASGVLATAGEGHTAEESAAQLLGALLSREAIAHAEGTIMAQQGISANAASAELRRSARRQTVTVRALAASTIAATSPTDHTRRTHR